ncbi:tetratricopeptide repeat protein [Candidatus Pelagibacter sp.]|jgi:tetratricopeptide (TPR) repeat protein|nr:tetratricopeptide repeat protein [Candidatus Pelagibacter sp.]
MIIIKKIFILVIAIFFLNSSLYAAGSSNDGPKKLKNYESAKIKIKKAKKLEKKGKDEKAQKLYKASLKFLLKANEEISSDPDTLNYLGFVSRKLGKFDDAEVYYLLGLEIDPKHKGINEYLGELYVITKRIKKARERLAVLENCNCEEYGELKGIIEGTKKSKY